LAESNSVLDPASAKRLMLERASSLPPIRVKLKSALGLVLAEEVLPLDDQPPFDNSAMDGYALRATDTRGATAERPRRLEVIEVIPAGKMPIKTIAAGQAAKIMTGAPLPRGADAVMRVENTFPDGTGVLIKVEAKPGQEIRKAGEDLQQGRVVLHAGQALHPGRIGLIAAAGLAEVAVHARPRIGILITGEELVEPGEPLPPGKIRNSNGYALYAQILEAGGEPVSYGIVGDDREATKKILQKALAECQVVLSTGGVSMGDFDVVEAALAEAGAQILFTKVTQRPGAPLVGAAAGSTLFFGLPGNPVSSMVCFEVFVRPVIRKMLGRRNLERPTITGYFAEAFKKPAGLTYWARVIVEQVAGKNMLRPSAPQGSGVLRSMALGHGLAEIPADRTAAGPDDPVQVRIFAEDE